LRWRFDKRSERNRIDAFEQRPIVHVPSSIHEPSCLCETEDLYDEGHGHRRPWRESRVHQDFPGFEKFLRPKVS